ncbi:MAG TPA: hypothetical protein PLV57_16555 [Phycisphaerae bacterium]|nr:hypothetical protein [Phycisphaerae bacterium]
MRIGTALPAIVLSVVFCSASLVWAASNKGDVTVEDRGDVQIRTYSLDDSSNARSSQRHDRWNRGDWTTREQMTVRTERVDPMNGMRGQPMATATRVMSGPYRYFYTDQEGKYNYFLDHYGYPYEYGGRETQLPVNVLGYVPPQAIGGGPVMYFRAERPLSRSIFD